MARDRGRVAVSLSFPIPFSFPRARLPNYLSLPPSFCPSTTTTPRLSLLPDHSNGEIDRGRERDSRFGKLKVTNEAGDARSW